MTYNAKETGRRLADLRRRIGFTQPEVADRLGVTRDRITAMEGGRRLHTPYVVALADLYDVSLDYLYGRTPETAVDGIEDLTDEERSVVMTTVRAMAGAFRFLREGDG